MIRSRCRFVAPLQHQELLSMLATSVFLLIVHFPVLVEALSDNTSTPSPSLSTVTPSSTRRSRSLTTSPSLSKSRSRSATMTESPSLHASDSESLTLTQWTRTQSVPVSRSTLTLSFSHSRASPSLTASPSPSTTSSIGTTSLTPSSTSTPTDTTSRSPPSVTASPTSAASCTSSLTVTGGTRSDTPSWQQSFTHTRTHPTPTQATRSPTYTRTPSSTFVVTPTNESMTVSESSSKFTPTQPTRTPTTTLSPSTSTSPTREDSNSATVSVSHEPSASGTVTDSSSTTATITPPPTPTPTSTFTMTASFTVSNQRSTTPTVTSTPTPTMSLSPTLTSSPSLTDSPSPSVSITPSVTSTGASLSDQITDTWSLSPELTASGNTDSMSHSTSMTPSMDASGSPTSSWTLSCTMSATPSLSVSHEPSTSASLSSSPTVSVSPERSLSTSASSTPTPSETPTPSPSASNEVTASIPSVSLTHTWTEDPSPSESNEETLTDSTSWTRSPTPSWSDTTSSSSSLTVSQQDRSRSESGSPTTSGSPTDTDDPTITRSPSHSHSATYDLTSTMTESDTVTTTKSSTRGSASFSPSENPCDTVHYENVTDVIPATDMNTPNIASLQEKPYGPDSTVVYSLSRVEFSQVRNIDLTLHLDTPLRNEYGTTSLTWSPQPSVTNCQLNNYSLLDMYTIRFTLTYIANEKLGVSDNYLCNLTFLNDAFACPMLLTPNATTVDGGEEQQQLQSSWNVTASVLVIGGEADLSFGETMLRVLGTIAGVLTGGAALLHQSRANSINSFADCQYSLVDPLSFGDHPLQFGMGDPVGYYLRGAVVGNACFFFMVVFAHFIAVLLLTLRAYYVDYYDPMHPPESKPIPDATATTDSAANGEDDDAAAEEAQKAKEKEAKKHTNRPLISRAHFPFAQELQYRASIARFPSASVAGAVLTFDGTCTASMSLIMHPQMSFDQALGILGLIFAVMFVVILFVITHNLFQCKAQRLSRKYEDVDTPTDEDEDDPYELAEDGTYRVVMLKEWSIHDIDHTKPKPVGANASPVGGRGNQLPHRDGDPLSLIDPPASPRKKKPTNEVLHGPPPSAWKRLKLWLFSPRIKWVRSDKHPYFKGMYMSLFEDYTIATFGCAEVVLSLIIAVASGVMISRREICNGLAALSLGCLFIFIAAVVYLNPFISRMDLFHTIAANCFAFLGAILLFVYSRQVEPDASLANAADNLATMVSVLNVIKFLTDIVAKGKQFRERIGLEGEQRTRASKKKHLKLLKRAMTKGNVDGESALAFAKLSDGKDSGGPDGSEGTRSELGSVLGTSMRNVEFASSWSGSTHRIVKQPRDRLTDRHSAVMFPGDDDHLTPPLTWRRGPLSADSADYLPPMLQLLAVGDAPDATKDDGGDSKVPVNVTPADAAALQPSVRYERPPIAAPTSLQELQQRIKGGGAGSRSVQFEDRQHEDVFVDGVEDPAVPHLTTSFTNLSASMALSSSHRDRHTNISSHSKKQHPMHGVTGDDIEHALAVEHATRRDASWFGGIIGGEASTNGFRPVTLLQSSSASKMMTDKRSVSLLNEAILPQPPSVAAPVEDPFDEIPDELMDIL